MSVFSSPAFDDHEQVVFCRDPESGLKAIIAIHNTSRGPALGGCRMWPYASEEEAIADVLRLSRGMTYKSALAGLPYGGGKSVIIADPKRDKSPALFHAMGRAVESLNGLYTVAEDVGISVADVEAMMQATRHVAGVRGRGGGGDPSPATAYGVFMGIRAAVTHKLGQETLRGVRVAVQGAGHVGEKLVRHLVHVGAEVLVADIDPTRAQAVAEAQGARAVPAEGIVAAEAEVFAPCALGAVIDDDTLPRLKARIVAGAANNQLAEARHGRALRDRGILYAPDYVINAGGIIYISHEGPGYNESKAFAHVARIHETLLTIFQRADREGMATSDAADHLAEEHFTHPKAQSAVAA